MSGEQWLALAPLLTLSGGILVLMLVIAFARGLATAATGACVVLAATLAAVLWAAMGLDTGVVVTPLLLVDGFALLLAAFMLLAAMVIVVLGYEYMRGGGDRGEEFFLLILLATLGGVSLVASTHVAAFILSLELLGVSIYALVAYPTDGHGSLEAALKYLVLSGVSSAFILFGAALLYAATGSMAFADLSEGVAAGGDWALVMAGAAMFVAGVGFKLSLVPFHMWTPDVYEGAPAPVTALLATIAKGAVFAVLLRLYLPAGDFSDGALFKGIWLIAIASMIGGNLLALLQDNVKRVLAYSSIAHFGYLLVAFLAGGITGGKEMALEASLFYLAAYFVTTLGAFGVVSLLSSNPRKGGADVDSMAAYEGLLWRRPLLGGVLAAMLLSLAGIPLTAGFVAKFYLVTAGVTGALWWLVGALVLGSVMGLWYYLRIILVMTRKVDVVDQPVDSVTGGVVMILLTIALLVLGVYPAPMIELINEVVGSVSWI